MPKLSKILLIVKNSTRRQLYHEFLVNAGYSVYICDEISHALARLAMSEDIDTIILDSDFPNRGVQYFMQTINQHYQWSDTPLLIIDSAEKGSKVRNIVNRRPFKYTQSIDPQDVLKLLKDLLL